MRTSIFLIGAAFVLLGAQAQAGENCIRWSELGSFKRVDASTAEVRGKGHAVYSVRFRTACMPLEDRRFWVADRHTESTCFAPGQILRLTEGGACVVDSVSKIEG